MTKRQSQALAYIRSFIEEHGFSPSFREVGDGIGAKSSESANRLIHALADQGYITFIPARARTIRLVQEAA